MPKVRVSKCLSKFPMSISVSFKWVPPFPTPSRSRGEFISAEKFNLRPVQSEATRSDDMTGGGESH